MLLVFLSAILVSSTKEDAFASDNLRQHTDEEIQQILGPFANIDPRLNFPCSGMTPSSPAPTSVHALRPADIKHIAAMGDSLTAANGAKALTAIGVLNEHRGVSWSIGGESSLKSVITLPNIFREFNSQVTGYSSGTGDRNSSTAGFNVAKPGAVSADMPGQAELLVDRMNKTLGASKFNSEWKLVTFFIGGNDLCAACQESIRFSPQAYRDNIKKALDILKLKMPRTFVNFVTVLNVVELEDLHQGWICTFLQLFLCDCPVKDQTTKNITRFMSFEYQKLTTELIDSGVYDTSDDFTVVRQPFMETMTVPLTAGGQADFSYFAPDCFHFSQKGHGAAAVELWNNMMEKVGQKTTFWNINANLLCPTGNGYIYTMKNS